MPLAIEQMLQVQHHQILEIAVSPDDRSALVVMAGEDRAPREYLRDIRYRAIHRVDLNTGQSQVIAAGEFDGHAPGWSPDAKRIAFLAHRSGDTRIWLCDAEGREMRPACDAPLPAGNPFYRCSLRWSPDGRWIAFTFRPDGGIDPLERPAVCVWHSSRPKAWEGIRRPHAVGVLDLVSGRVTSLLRRESSILELLAWSEDARRVLVRRADELLWIDIAGGDGASIYNGPADRVAVRAGEVLAACAKENVLTIGTIRDGTLVQIHTHTFDGVQVKPSAWSYDGGALYGVLWKGASSRLFRLDRATGELALLTPTQTVVSGGPIAMPVTLHGRDEVLFPYQGPARPMELWSHGEGQGLRPVSQFNANITEADLPEVRIVHYPSGGHTIESLLVLPREREPNRPLPGLIYLHGGPTRHIAAALSDLTSGRADSAAAYLAGRGYAVLLPNFRGSWGYGDAFMKELSGYRMVEAPFADVMAGVDFAIEQGWFDPDRLGIYGASFGAWVTSWAITQTSRFKGAVASVGMFYDGLHRDRIGRPFYCGRPHWSEGTDPDAPWKQPEIYRRLSPLEHIGNVRTPTLIIDTAEAEGKEFQGHLFCTGLRFHGVETCHVQYARPFHQGGWSDGDQRDYILRIQGWFDYTLIGRKLPEWFLG